MNFLAHLFLSCEQEDLLIGNFLADFITNKEVNALSDSIQQGIQLHRKIDSYTDNHELVRKGVHRLYSDHHKYAPVIIDVLYDYFLAKNWAKYHHKSLNDFATSVYAVLEKKLEVMPDKVKPILPRMIADDWLVGYSKIEGIRYTFERMKRRVSKPEHLDNVIESLKRDHDILDREFNQFFPDVIQYVNNECLCF